MWTDIEEKSVAKEAIVTITIMFLELLHAYGLVAKKAVDVRFSFILQSRMAGIARKGKGALKLESI